MISIHAYPSLEQWIDYIFDHPIDPPGTNWYYPKDGPSHHYTADEIPLDTAGHITELFEHPLEHLARFSDEQLDQGFWFLVHEGGSGLTPALVDPAVPFEWDML